MYVLFLCSFWGTYLVIQKLLYLRHNHVDLEAISDKTKGKLLSVGKERTLHELKQNQNIVYRLIAQSIKFSNLPKDDVQEIVQDITATELPQLEKSLSVLDSVITVAPILGLLGTVLGLMDIFNVISDGSLGNASALSSGIAEALITTVTGLSITIPFIFLRQHLSHKVDAFVIDLERIMNDILRFCKTNTGVKP